MGAFALMMAIKPWHGAINPGQKSRPSSDRPSVCFVAPSAYSALSGREDLAHVGGAERQQVILGAELVQRGYRVSFVVLDHGQPDGEEIRGIRVFRCYRAEDGIRALRFVYPRLTGLWSAMRRCDADVYYQRGADPETGLVSEWCRRHRRRFIFAAAHDTNCTPAPAPLARRSDRWLYRLGLQRADVIIAQTIQQQRMLRATLGLPSVVIRSSAGCLPEVERAAERPIHNQEAARVLWVGRLSEEKRPEWLIRLATELPLYGFDVVGQCNQDSKYGRVLEDRIRYLPNVRWHG